MKSDDHPLWYTESEDDVPPGPVLLAAAVAYTAAACVYGLPGRLFDAAARFLTSRSGSGRICPGSRG